MGKYLLLRNNKESGPYLLEDLVRLGLKPYDLVWVDGKSAAWRYPSEINELKPYAPVAEEQPFDRFYKKNQEEKQEHTPLVADQSPYAPPATPKEELKFVPKRSVFVTLPNQKVQARAIEESRRMPPQSPPEPPPAPANESPEIAEIKYSQPLDEIKEMYVRTLKQRKAKSARRIFLIANLKRVAVIVGLVFLGIAAGFLIKSKPGKSREKDGLAIQSAGQVPPTTAIGNQLVEESSPQNNLSLDDQSIVKNETEKTELEKNSDESNNEGTEGEQTKTIRIRKETMIRPAEKKEQINDDQTFPGAESDVATGQRTRKVRSDNNAIGKVDQPETKARKNRLKDLVSVSSNDYKRVAFGGIRNLELTVTNNSGFELDQVVVELQYLKPSEEPLRTENIRFEAISPHTSATIRVPDTNRGIKVLYKIINIESKQNDDVAGM